MVSTLVYCIRHGQTAENLQGIIQGQLDTKLDEVGLAQAVAVAQTLKGVSFDAAFTSDLARAADTAKAIMKHHPGIPLEELPVLRERHLGSLQGQSAFRKRTLDESAETSMALVQRTLRFWDEKVMPLARGAAESGKDDPCCILVVSHGAYIATLARAVVDHRKIVKAPDVAIAWCPNVSLTLFEVEVDGTGLLRSFGDTSHLITKPATIENADEIVSMGSK